MNYHLNEIEGQLESIYESTFQIAVLTDIQYADADPFLNRYFRNSTQKLENALKQIDRYDISFILDLGDVIDRDYESFQTVLTVYNTSPLARYHLLGNHDLQVEDNLKDNVFNKLNMPEPYYSFCFNSWRFIMLNGNEISFHGTKQDSKERRQAEKSLQSLKAQNAIQANPWNGGISQTQKNWLEGELLKAKEKNERVIVCNHFPIYPPNTHNLWNDYEIIEILESFEQVKAYFCGHNHEGNYAQKKHIHYINYKGLVETEFETAFAIVELSSKNLIINGIDRENSYYVNF